MSDQPGAKPTRRRGRPPTNVASEVDDDTLKARRQRNREAQNVFRKRRQAAEVAQAQRLTRLESIVEEMSSIFVNFVDEMLATEAISQQPHLVATLRRSMKHVLDLAHEVVGPEETEDFSTLPRVDAPPAAPTNIPVAPSAPAVVSPFTISDSQRTPSTSPPGLSSTSSHTSEEQLECDLHLGSDAAHQDCLAARALALPAPPGITDNIPEPETPPNERKQTLKHSSLPPQIYGNGWTVNNHPMLVADGAEFWGPRMPLATDSFAYRLAKSSLTIAYLILTKNHYPPIPLSEEQRIFGENLCFRGRDDTLIRIRWLLGPGSEYMYRVVDLPYGQHGDQIFTRSDLNPTFDELGWPAITKARLESNKSARYLSVLGVEKQLLALGGRMVDNETLELNIVNPTVPPNQTSSTVSSQPESWSFVDFFSPNQLRPQPQVLTMQLSIGLLVSNLAKAAVCLMRGPGYPRDSLGDAIQASVIKVI